MGREPGQSRRHRQRCRSPPAWESAQAQQFLAAPAPTRKKGLSDRVLLGCGLRRGELGGRSLLTWRKREGRWAIVDLAGKQGRVRTVSMPSWAKAAPRSSRSRLRCGMHRYRTRRGIWDCGRTSTTPRVTGWGSGMGGVGNVDCKRKRGQKPANRRNTIVARVQWPTAQ